ncbi:MAG: ribonuclease III [Clostridiales bacterium]|jgi:ribonuclease-3 family protein|nr:ribonuclease III [Clostridiales bacterium]MCI1960720.1 ribonuclease III [Clostridiales bacterium]MCI2021161.1 ribonuclease III [Clostridiales bacterium]MCI2025544.1 ribonuclease III [Clostridiales bacterium]
MDRFLAQTECDPKSYSPLTLAFIGDGVFELFVRERLVLQGNCPVKELHKHAVKQVQAAAQAMVVPKLEPILSEEEISVLKRGRNAHVGHVPKNASVADYHAATALESLFGYLYLKGDLKRLQELFLEVCKIQMQDIEKTNL